MDIILPPVFTSKFLVPFPPGEGCSEGAKCKRGAVSDLVTLNIYVVATAAELSSTAGGTIDV